MGQDEVGAGGAGEGFVWFWGEVGHGVEQEVFAVARCGRGSEGSDHAPLGNQFGHEGSLAQPRGDGEGQVHGRLGAVGDPGASFGGGDELVAVFVVEEGCGEGVVECLGEEVFLVLGTGGCIGLCV